MTQYHTLPFARLLLLVLFFWGLSLAALAQEQSIFPLPTNATLNLTEIPLAQSNSIGWGIGYVTSDKGNIRQNGFPGLGLQFSTSYTRQVSPMLALEASCSVMSSSFVRDILGTGFGPGNDTLFLSASLTRRIQHAMTTTISANISPFEQGTMFSALSFGGGVSLRWSGVSFAIVEVAPNQQYRLQASFFAHSLALGGHLFIGYKVPLSDNSDILLRAFTDIFLPPRYIIEDRVSPLYGAALQQLQRSPLFIGSGDGLYQYGGTIGLSAMFKLSF